MHHWSFDLDDGLEELTQRLEGDGHRIVDRFDAGNGNKTAFISPRSAHGVLVQFWQIGDFRPEERPPRARMPLRDGTSVEVHVDHLALAVHDVRRALEFFRRYFPVTLGQPLHFGYDGSFRLTDFRISGYKVELIEGRPEQPGFVQRFLERRGEGLHHISIDIDRLDPYLAQLESEGVRIVDRFDMGNGWKTAFISPRSAYGVLIQFWQKGH
jgi:catechol 2,3-dioxygenase-like lactoylglutathione lyase family enzyme